MNNLFIIVSHTRFSDNGEAVHGTASELAPYLEKKKKNYLYIQHSLFSGMATQIIFVKNRKKNIKTIGLRTLPFPLRIVQEYIITISVILQNSTKESTYIGIDPLNAFLGILLKRIGKVKKVIFYTADYAEKRYENTFMNEIYHWFDRFSISNADQIWNVSSRITALRKKQGVPDAKNFFIPNTPLITNKKKGIFSFEKHTLVIVTHITKAIDFKSIIEAVKNLQKKYKDIKLFIVGDGEYREELGKKVSSMSLEKRIIFTGSKPHAEVMKILSKSGVGLAIYTDDFPWTKYGDSMKAREYLACGLPVIITSIPSTADDIKRAHAGIVIKHVNELEAAIDDLFFNEKSYIEIKKNAIAMAKKFDFAKTVANASFEK